LLKFKKNTIAGAAARTTFSGGCGMKKKWKKLKPNPLLYITNHVAAWSIHKFVIAFSG
jgi:hypothetical protein